MKKLMLIFVALFFITQHFVVAQTKLISRFYPVKNEVFIKNSDTLNIFIDSLNDALLFCNDELAKIMNELCLTEDTSYFELKKIRKLKKALLTLSPELRSHRHFSEVEGIIQKKPVYLK